ncbi:MAG: FemAB family PEP-CTERM system-associated protein [Fibrobacter sp.]|mgnify:CR=1 FL=1|jgi:serine/alanine adding enzyme|nr:FemAB family PEP-CTERM system-associated protein [Fibrobacter sp.]
MVRIVPYTRQDSKNWDSFVKAHPHANLYHLSFFRSVVEKTYGHQSLYFQAVDENSQIRGILPLFFIRSLIFGKELVSLPFCDYGGILADSPEISQLLFQKAEELMRSLRCKNIELRQVSKQHFLDKKAAINTNLSIKTTKVRMFLNLPESADTLFSSFPAKLRSQIRKPQKDGCTCLNGGIELLDDFYDVFLFNMRDLGSPVHSKQIIKNMLSSYPRSSHIFVVYHSQRPVACSLVCSINDMLVNPWASFKRTYQKSAPNMLLYWEMLKFAINNGYRVFDFGRSTPNEGTYRFKAQWGASIQPLYWYRYGSNAGSSGDISAKEESFKKIWRKLPLRVTAVVGPMIRKHIHL